MDERLYCFKPIINKNAKILILGSFPGIKSLSARQYYAHPQNQFWKILSGILEIDLVSIPYKEKVKALLRNGIGLWDMVNSCSRTGSSDTNIRNSRLNDIEGMIERYPNIRVIFFNGRTSQKLFIRSGCVYINNHYLPSTSPAHTQGYQNKKKRWSEISIRNISMTL